MSVSQPAKSRRASAKAPGTSRGHILVVEDEQDLQDLLKFNLEREGFEVTGVADGELALSVCRSHSPQLVLLDLMLPGRDGLEVCKTIKSDPELASTPVVMLTAKGEEADIVVGLELGADDYITKPFSPRVLVARLRAVLRRGEVAADEPEDQVVCAGGLTIHPARREVLLDGESVTLTNTEFSLLHMLARRPGRVFTRDQVIRGVRGQNVAVTDRSVDVHVASLRKKLGDHGALIETVRGVGYRLKDA